MDMENRYERFRTAGGTSRYRRARYSKESSGSSSRKLKSTSKSGVDRKSKTSTTRPRLPTYSDADDGENSAESFDNDSPRGDSDIKAARRSVPVIPATPQCFLCNKVVDVLTAAGYYCRECLVPCRYCGIRCLPTYRNHHENKCSGNVVPCPGCRASFQAQSFAAHVTTCPSLCTCVFCESRVPPEILLRHSGETWILDDQTRPALQERKAMVISSLTALMQGCDWPNLGAVIAEYSMSRSTCPQAFECPECGKLLTICSVPVGGWTLADLRKDAIRKHCVVYVDDEGKADVTGCPALEQCRYCLQTFSIHAGGVKKHLENVCGKIVACDDCGKEMAAYDLVHDHVLQCTRGKDPCEKCAQLVYRDETKQHSQICPEEWLKLDCKCRGRVKRKDMVAHDCIAYLADRVEWLSNMVNNLLQKAVP